MTDRTAAERQRRYRERLREGGSAKFKLKLQQRDREIARLKAKIAELTAKPTKKPAEASTVADDIWGDLPPVPQKVRRAKR
jgi:hypothetical protein